MLIGKVPFFDGMYQVQPTRFGAWVFPGVFHECPSANPDSSSRLSGRLIVVAGDSNQAAFKRQAPCLPHTQTHAGYHYSASGVLPKVGGLFPRRGCSSSFSFLEDRCTTELIKQ